MSQQTINLFVIVLLLVHGEVGGSGLFEESPAGHLLPGPSDLPDPFLPGPFDVDHHHMARSSPINNCKVDHSSQISSSLPARGVR